MLIPGLNTDTVKSIRPFVDVAMNMGPASILAAGGSITVTTSIMMDILILLQPAGD